MGAALLAMSGNPARAALATIVTEISYREVALFR